MMFRIAIVSLVWFSAGYLLLDRWAAQRPPHTTGFAQVQGSSLHATELP